MMAATAHTATLASSRIDPRLHAAAQSPEVYNVAPLAIGPVNEFIPFAANIGANIEDQRAWAASSEVQFGYPPGSILPSLGANKAWRQSTFIAAGVAQTIAEVLHVDMLDDGDLPLFVRRFRQAITSLGSVGGGGGFEEPPQTGLVYGRQWVIDTRTLDPHSARLGERSGGPQWTPVLPLSGGVLTGPLTLAGAPLAPNQAVTRAYVESLTTIGTIHVDGGTIQGTGLSAADPLRVVVIDAGVY